MAIWKILGGPGKFDRISRYSAQNRPKSTFSWSLNESKNWKARYFDLKEDSLNYYKGKDDLNWTIEMALAGYNKKDIEVKYADNTITIKSTHKDEEDKDTIHRGIAKRHFTRSFTTADDVEVRGAEM